MASQRQPSRRQYRPAKPLPYQLRDHCNVYFEEKLYYHALNFLLSILSSGTTTSRPALVPAPQHLALAATFVVHPFTTTHAKSAEIQQAANTALQLLHLTNTLVDPVTAKFNVAFTFTYFSVSRHGGRKLKEKDPNGSGAIEGDDSEPLNLELAKRGSLWSRAQDFWEVVGWAFNCSVLHPKRWSRWKLWLGYMCDILEDDWAERTKMTLESSSQSIDEEARSPERNPSKDSLIFQYIDSNVGISSPQRRILRAIFADGSESATIEFREVFYNELKELEQEPDRPQKRQVDVDIDEDVYGDYMGRDNEDEEFGSDPDAGERERPRRPKRLRTTTRRPASGATSEVDSVATSFDDTQFDRTTGMADSEALVLRQRLLQLLSNVSQSFPKDFMPLSSHYDLIAEFTRHLPLPTFQLLVSPSMAIGLPPDAQMTLCEKLLFSLGESASPESDEKCLSQRKLETCFLPYGASSNGVIDNAKFSLLVESVMRSLLADGALRATPTLREAVREGIDRRAANSQSDAKKSQARLRAEETGWVWLLESGDRMNYIIDKIFAAEGLPE